MSEDYIKEQIRRMIAFIDQEASEKVEEIDAKAEEEFVVEKTKILQRERERLSDDYRKKQKSIELELKREVCGISSDSRLAKLKVKQQILSDLRDEVFGTVGRLSGDRYAQLLSLLVEEGVAMIRQPEVIRRRPGFVDDVAGFLVRCREQDLAVVRSALRGGGGGGGGGLSDACVDEASFLPADSAGGVVVSGMGGRIQVDNTLETRTDVAFAKAVPRLRAILFGSNPHRKFVD